MTRKDHQIRYGAVFEPAPQLPAFRRYRGRELCELRVVRNLQKSCVKCVNFARQAARQKGAVICVNFGLERQHVRDQTGMIRDRLSGFLVQGERSHA